MQIGFKLSTGERVGETAPNGAVYYQSDDGSIDEARGFLRERGLEVGENGWESRDGRLRGAIYFDCGYCAAYWQADATMWAIELRLDGTWKPLVSKIKSREQAEDLLPKVKAMFILGDNHYRIAKWKEA